MDLDRYCVADGKNWKLKDHNPDDTDGFADRAAGEAHMAKLKDELIELERRLYASAEHGILLVLQALDAGGKDGTIRSIFSGLNPQGIHVSSFKAPSPVEMAHDYLWRIHHSVPARGRMVIFNRSHYEEVVVVRVHADKLLPAWARERPKLWEERFESINDFEKHLTRNNITIVKCFLNISKGEQKKRIEKRLNDPKRNWKFSPSDLAERAHWEDYMEAFEQSFKHTGTKHAPWYVIPSNNKWFRNVVITELLVRKLRKLNLQYPKADPETLKGIVVK